MLKKTTPDGNAYIDGNRLAVAHRSGEERGIDHKEAAQRQFGNDGSVFCGTMLVDT